MKSLGNQLAPSCLGARLQPSAKEQKNIKTTKDVKRLVAHRNEPHQLTINFSNDSAQFSQQLGKLAKQSKYVESLTLNFENCECLTDEVMLQLAKLLSNQFPYLKHFSFTEGFKSGITATGYQALATGIGNLESLATLNLRLRPHFKPEEAFSCIVQSIKGMKNLKKLDLSLMRRAGIGDQVISDLAKNILHNTSLIDLSFSVEGCKLATSPHSLNNLATSLQRLVNLEKLKLYFPHTSMPAEGLNQIAPALKQLKFLTEFAFQVDGYAITNEELMRLGKLLSKLTSLTKLLIRFTDSSQLKIEGLERLMVNLKNLTELSELTLRFRNSSLEVTHQGKLQVAAAARKFKNLSQPYFSTQ
jgi:hypothetical protein